MGLSDFYRADDTSLTASNQDFRPSLNEAGLSGSPSIMSASAEFSGLVTWVRRRLGAPILEVELVPDQITSAFEEAILKFSGMVNAYFMQSWAAQQLGISRDYSYDSQRTLPTSNNVFLKAFMGNQNGFLDGKHDFRRGFILPDTTRQTYDFYSESIDADSGLPLEQYVASVSGYDVGLIEMAWNAGSYTNRVYDPMSNQQFFQAEFGFPSYPTDTVFYILPLWQDVGRGSLLKANDYARKSQYRYDLYGRTLELIPTPKGTGKVWFKYWIQDKPGTEVSPLARSSFSGLSYLSTTANPVATNFGNIPVTTLTYDQMNDTGRTWVREYVLGICYEILGTIREKMTIPIPGGETITLNGSQLVAMGQAIRQRLLDDLKGFLENMDTYKLMEKEAAKATAQMEILKLSPMPIYFI